MTTRSMRGFTLLESIIALAILGAVCVVCIQVRTQGLVSAERLARQQRVDRATEAVFQMLVANMLPSPEMDPVTQRAVWKGEHLGKTYRVTRERLAIENPVAGQVDYKVGPTVGVWKYTLAYEGRESEFYWHR